MELVQQPSTQIPKVEPTIASNLRLNPRDYEIRTDELPPTEFSLNHVQQPSGVVVTPVVDHTPPNFSDLLLPSSKKEIQFKISEVTQLNYEIPYIKPSDLRHLNFAPVTSKKRDYGDFEEEFDVDPFFGSLFDESGLGFSMEIHQEGQKQVDFVDLFSEDIFGDSAVEDGGGYSLGFSGGHGGYSKSRANKNSSSSSEDEVDVFAFDGDFSSFTKEVRELKRRERERIKKEEEEEQRRQREIERRRREEEEERERERKRKLEEERRRHEEEVRRRREEMARREEEERREERRVMEEEKRRLEEEKRLRDEAEKREAEERLRVESERIQRIQREEQERRQQQEEQRRRWEDESKRAKEEMELEKKRRKAEEESRRQEFEKKSYWPYLSEYHQKLLCSSGQSVSWDYYQDYSFFVCTNVES